MAGAAAAPMPINGSSGGSSDSYASATGLQPAALYPLMADLGFPPPLEAARQPLHAVNFWASLQAMRSSLHYDPYQNLLCVVRQAGCVGLDRLAWVCPARWMGHLVCSPFGNTSCMFPSKLLASNMLALTCSLPPCPTCLCAGTGAQARTPGAARRHAAPEAAAGDARIGQPLAC